jgi:hypothetical protein
MASSKATVTLAFVVALVFSACFVGGDEVVLAGVWESTQSVGGRSNSLEIDEKLSGSATIYFYYGDDPTLYVADYVAVASTIEDDVSYRISMFCDGDCSALDFTMICRVIEGKFLDCTGSDLFASYEALHFERSTH